VAQVPGKASKKLDGNTLQDYSDRRLLPNLFARELEEKMTALLRISMISNPLFSNQPVLQRRRSSLINRRPEMKIRMSSSTVS